MSRVIQELSVQDFAIISNLNITFKDGMTTLTGETGAGKSIIIDAMGLLVGGRGSADFVRKGAEKCRIEGSFFVEHQEELERKLNDIGIEMDDNVVFLQREIFRSGRNNCRINGQLVNTKTLRDVGRWLVDIHGQNEHQELMQAHAHLSLLDSFSTTRIPRILLTYKEVFHRYDNLRKEIDHYLKNEKEYAQRMDMLSFQYEEIEGAALVEQEEDRLIETRNKLMNFQKIADSLKIAYSAVEGEGDRALDMAGTAMNAINSIEELDSEYVEVGELLRTSYYSLQEAATTLSSLMDNLEMDEEKLLEIDTRLDLIRQLKRKYGNSVADILDYFETIKEELGLDSELNFNIEARQEELSALEEQLDSLSKELTEERRVVARKLEKDVMIQLKELYMENTTFEVMFYPLDHYVETGLDRVEFYISTNIGEELKPLVKVASGGELSRIMLALKTIFSQSNEITSIVFDEVDTGVSGRVAQAIAEKIHQVGRNSQVLCITHLPQVAAVSDMQYFIEKRVIDERTETRIRELTEEERVREIARMLSGSEITPLTLEHANELLELAKNK